MKEQQNKKPQQSGREGGDDALTHLGETELQQTENQEDAGYPNEERVTESDTPQRVRGNEDPAGTGLPSKE